MMIAGLIPSLRTVTSQWTTVEALERSALLFDFCFFSLESVHNLFLPAFHASLQHGNGALALMRLDYVIGVATPSKFSITLPNGERIGIEPHVPNWWPDTLPGLSTGLKTTIFDAKE